MVFRQMPVSLPATTLADGWCSTAKAISLLAWVKNNQRPTAQELDKLQGKVVRLTEDGKVPPDNPFVNTAGARSEIWSYGIRNPQDGDESVERHAVAQRTRTTRWG